MRKNDYFLGCAVALAASVSAVLPAHALDVAQPARVHVTVADAGDKPLSGATVRLERDVKPVAVWQTDGGGKAEITAPGGGRILWPERIVVEKSGYVPQVLPLTLFAGADVDQPAVLEAAHTTVIHVVGPDGRPVPHAELYTVIAEGNQMRVWPVFNRLTSSLRTDERGDYRWVHGRAPEGFVVESGAHGEWFADAAEVTVKLTETHAAQVAQHALRGRLLLADGSPAAGWHVNDGIVETMMNSSGGLVWFFYRAEKIEPVAADGTFALADAPSMLFAISPQGVPLMYNLNPATWESGAHRVTLTLPKLTGSTSGRVLDERNQPLAGVTVIPHEFYNGEYTWQFSVGDAASGSPGTNPGQVLGALTDAQGRFTIASPSSTPVSVAIDRTGWTLNRVAGSDDYRLQAPTYSQAGGDTMACKDITLRFVDAAGKDAGFAVPLAVDGFVGTRGALWGGAGDQRGLAADRRGWHYFVEPGANRILVHYYGNDGLWQAFDRTLTLTGTSDQQVTVPLSEDLRLPPLDGTVLDPAGKPAAHVAVDLALHGQNSWTTATQTDEAGHFHFAGAPPEATISVPGPNYFAWRTPGAGYMDALPIRGQVPLVLHLQPFGQVRILLPKGYGRAPESTSLMTEVRASDVGGGGAAVLHLDAAHQTLECLSIVPGSYHLNAQEFPGFADIAQTQIKVAPGQETLIDLRQHAFTPTEERWATCRITADGKPVSGAKVAVFSNPPVAGPTDALQSVTCDLSDEQGMVRFRATVGTQYVAVAAVQGKWAGWQKVPLDKTAPRDADATVQLRTARTLTMPVLNDNMYQVKVVFTNPAGIEAQALSQFGANAWIGSNLYLHHDGKQLTLQDLPVGVECELQPVGGSMPGPQRVQIVAGEGPLVVTPGRSPAP